jgi:alginate O-acetyltransferase complex protein AlgI
MSLAEIEFLLFLPVVCAAYWLGPRSRVWQNGVLLVASYVFYASWEPKLLGLLLVGTLVDYTIVRRLSTTPNTQVQQRRAWLALSLTLNIGTLAAFKYADFFVTAATQALATLGVEASLPALHWLLPLGLSFYTLQRIGYVLDVYWDRTPATRSLLDFSLFVAFFPQITAGPISRGSELLPQISTARTLEARWWVAAAGALGLGFALKTWVAPIIGPAWVDPVFAAPTEFTRASLWLAAVGYMLQVFADFAGYSLLAIGAARVFAIELPVNFSAPLASTSLPELWRRWHITLNRWLFDYIFTPLTTSRGWFRGRFDVALLAVFLISGLWHGASWTFVVWGVLHGIGMVVQRNWDERYKSWCRRDRRFVAWRKSSPYRLLAWVVTIGFFALTMIPFRAHDLATAGQFAAHLFAGGGQTASPLTAMPTLAALFVLVVHVLSTEKLAPVRERWSQLPLAARGFAFGAAIAFLMLAAPLTKSAFIYQQF